MKHFTRIDPIEKLDLSARACNALRRADINTVGDLLDFPKENFLGLKNVGVKSITEITEAIVQIENFVIDAGQNAKNEVSAKFIGKDGQIYRDFPIEDIRLSRRSFNCLKRAGIDYISKLFDKTETDLYAIPNMGVKSVAEIIEARNQIILQSVSATQSSSTDTSDSGIGEFCRRVVQDIVKMISVHAGQLYEAILPFCESCAEMGTPLSVATETDVSLVKELYALPLLRCAIKESLLNHLESNRYGLDWADLIKCLPQFLHSEALIDEMLSEMVQDGDLLCSHDKMYERKYPTALEYAASLSKPQDCAVLTGRLFDKTLEEIGKEVNLTRERVRQIESKCLRKAPVLREDRYAFVFQKYNISKEDFLLGFREPEITYNYLLRAYKKGKHLIDDLATDPDFPDEFRKAAERVIYKNYVVLSGERVLCSRAELSEYILRTAGIDGLTFDEFSQYYQMLLEDLSLQDNPRFSVMDRGYSNKLASSDHVLWKYGQKLRYYNIHSYDYTDLLDGLNLNQYNNVEFSTLKFFRENSELMNDYDIQDEYELHNLLKKICTNEDYPQIHFKRMPNIEFGSADRDGQVMELLLALAPITNTDFAAAYEHEYGVLSQTVLANYMKNFDQYFYAGVYKVDAPMLSEIMLIRMKQILSGEFYLLSDIKNLYVHEFPQADPKLLNPYTLKSLGFRVYSNYAIKDKYPSAVEYFRTILTTEDIVDAQLFHRELLNTIAYTSEVYKLKATYDILEYAPLKYVNIRRLKHVDVEKETLRDYCQEAYQAAHAPYFTICSLRKSGFAHALDDLGFDEWFYASLISEYKDHFSCRRIGKNKLFRRGNEKVRLTDFLEWLLYSCESLSIDIHDLTEKLSSDYNIILEWYKIVEMIKGSALYYDAITEKLYADYDVYFEEI